MTSLTYAVVLAVSALIFQSHHVSYPNFSFFYTVCAAPSAASTGTSSAVVGGVTGGVIFIVLVAFIVLFVIAKKRRNLIQKPVLRTGVSFVNPLFSVSAENLMALDKKEYYDNQPLYDDKESAVMTKLSNTGLLVNKNYNTGNTGADGGKYAPSSEYVYTDACV